MRLVQQLELLIENAAVAAALFDTEMRYLACSRRWISDYALEGPLRGRSHYELFPEISQDLKAIHSRCLAGATDTQFAVPFRRRDGSAAFFNWSVHPWYNERGQVGGLIILTEAVTARLQLERALHEAEQAAEALRISEERFETVFRSSPISLTLSSSDRRLIDVNDAFETIVGYRRDEVIGRTADEIGIWVDPAQKEEAFRRVSAFGKLRAFEHQFRTKTGEIRIGLVSIEPVRIGMNQSLIVANVDITERKQAEQRLRASEQRYGALFFNSQDAVFLTNAAGKIEAANPAACRMLAMSEEEICRAGREGVLDQTDPRLIPALETRRSSGYAETELTLIRKDGSRLEAEVRSTLVGEQGQAFVIARDITERKRAEAEREQLSAQLAQAQKMESIGRLAGGVAHDFNNLLTVINGQSKLALDNLENSDLLRQRLQDILEAGERAAGLTRQLLAFSRQQVLESSVLDLNGVVTGMRSMLNPLMGDNVRVILDLSDQALPVFADRHQLEQVIMNLAVNARDAMPDGGCLLIETDVVERPEAVDGETHPGLYAVLVVGDTGAGMDETTKQRIFEPFFTTKEAGVGTGLGLSMVQGIVIQSGGSIEVDTRPSQGTKFKIYLPLRATPEKMNSGESEATPERSGGATILVVEDRAAVRKYVAEVLRTYGYEVIEAATAEEAVRQSESTKIHLIVTDVVMPGMNGVELVAELTKTRPSLKAVFMSGYPDYSGPRLPNGSTFLQKPFSPEELAQRIQAVLS